MFLLVSNFPNLAILVWKKIGENCANSRKNVNNKKKIEIFEITNLKKKIMMNIFLQIILVISTLNK
jgi:ascorbate-specific PTS system EIIC-type component UlaA